MAASSLWFFWKSLNYRLHLDQELLYLVVIDFSNFDSPRHLFHVFPAYTHKCIIALCVLEVPMLLVEHDVHSWVTRVLRWKVLCSKEPIMIVKTWLLQILSFQVGSHISYKWWIVFLIVRCRLIVIVRLEVDCARDLNEFWVPKIQFQLHEAVQLVQVILLNWLKLEFLWDREG
jgi:hypothetical protein